VKPIADISLFFRFENVTVAYASNIFKTFWPLNLGMLYPYPESLPYWQPILAVTLLAAVTGLALKLVGRYPYLLVGWLWYLGTFVPVVGFIVIGPYVTADRYTYIPLIGLFIMIIWGGSDLATNIRIRKKVAGGIAVAAVGTLAWFSHNQVGYWENDIKVYAHTLHVTRDNWQIHLNIGTAYRKINQNIAALEHYRKAVRIKPDMPELQLSVGEVLIDMGKIAAAVSHYENAIEILPGSAAIHTALAVALDKNGAVDRALAHFQRALAIDENFAEAHHGLGVALFQQGRVDRAIGHYRKTLRIDADYALAHYNLGAALFSIGDSKRARESFRGAISADPGYADPQYALGVLCLKEGDKYAAISHFNRALEICPTHKSAQHGLQLAMDK
jgi:tetratricopeptide (TPR) repeat protein